MEGMERGREWREGGKGRSFNVFSIGFLRGAPTFPVFACRSLVVCLKSVMLYVSVIAITVWAREAVWAAHNMLSYEWHPHSLPRMPHGSRPRHVLS